MTSGPDATDQARAWLRERGLDVPEAPRAASRADRSEAADRVGARPATRGPTRRGRRFADDRAPESGDAEDGPADPEAVARTVALRKLASQARTRHELEQALAAKQVPAEAADHVLDRLTEVGLVDDAAFARDWVSSRQTRRQLSRSALKRELAAKGVERDLVEAALDDSAVEDESELALTLARRKLRTMSGLSRDVRARRLAGVLARRGFGSSTIARTLDAVLDDVLDA